MADLLQGYNCEREGVKISNAIQITQRASSSLSSEIVAHVGICIVAFDAVTGKAFFQNQKGASLYGKNFEQSGTLPDWFATY
eukprot:1961885-Rhodomonas_salina.1